MPEDYASGHRELLLQCERVRKERKRLGLEGLVGGLSALIINTEPQNQQAAVAELLLRTGLDLRGVWQDESFTTCVLAARGGADVLVRSRREAADPNPFARLNDNPKSRHLPNTRLEALVFETPDLRRWWQVQRGRGVAFLSKAPVEAGNCLFVQTAPSPCTGTSVTAVQWLSPRDGREYSWGERLDWPLRKPASACAQNVSRIDHVALRVRAEHRSAAIVELMGLTSYDFHEAFYVDGLNSITNVTRHGNDPAIVLTSGITAGVEDARAGPTEMFVRNYGPRAHHVAFWTERIEETFEALRKDGQPFLIGLVGSPEEGLKQTFTKPSPHTLLVHEYIYRYGDFDGFFTKSNVTALTKATEKQ